METIILAGGLGTRLQNVVKNMPKPMADINGKPFLDFVLNFLHQQGVKHAVLAVSYKYELIQQYFKNTYKSISLSYSIEETPLGTGGALKQALNLCSEEEIFVCNGDTFFEVNLTKLLQCKHKSQESKLCVALKKMRNFDRYGRVELDEKGFITAFREKEFCKIGLINGGIYLLNNTIFTNFTDEQALNSEKKFSFEDFLQKYFKSLQARACVFDDYFIDIGVPEDYGKARMKFGGLR